MGDHVIFWKEVCNLDSGVKLVRGSHSGFPAVWGIESPWRGPVYPQTSREGRIWRFLPEHNVILTKVFKRDRYIPGHPRDALKAMATMLYEGSK